MNPPIPVKPSSASTGEESDADLQPHIAAAELHGLRNEFYNATVAKITPVHDELRILRVVPDGSLPPFQSGQFTSLGLGNWEPRVAGVDEEHLDPLHLRRLSKRAYSLSCSMLDASGQLRRASEFSYLEFYVALVRHAERRPPSLTPRLFALQTGDRLYVERHCAGHYTLDLVQPADDIFFFATGTGEAPHNAMIAELLARGHHGRIVSTVSVRLKRDAAYRAIHEELARRFSNYRHVLLTTREPENLDPTCQGFIGKQYVQDLVQSGSLERETGVPLDPSSAHVFLCGSPAMIGVSRGSQGGKLAVEPGSMLDLLQRRGFRPTEPKGPGNVHFERYW